MHIKTVSNFLQKLAGMSIATLALAATAQAVPVLQLDIDGGTYDTSAEDIVAPGPEFTLRALGTASGNTSESDLLAETYYVSVALTPQTSSSSTLGSFRYSTDGGTTWTTVAVTADMTYGRPPLETALLQGQDPNDLAGHGIYDTYFIEISFTFNTLNRCTEYNSADAPGGCVVDSEGDTLFSAIKFDVNSLDEDYGLHFDLYSTQMRNRQDNTDIDVDQFAPFSHDARYGCCSVPVPEPGTLALLGIGLLGLGFSRRRKSVI